MIRPDRIVGLLTGVVILAASQVAYACPVCFRVEDDGTVFGVHVAVLVLFGVTTGVLSGVATFIVRFIRRSRRAEDAGTGGGL